MTISNSASRVLNILNYVKNKNPNTKTELVWAEVFEIEETNHNKRTRKILASFELMSNEIESIKVDLKLNDHDEFNCIPLIDSIENLMTINSLSTTWGLSVVKLTNELFITLGYCREVLPCDEELANELDIAEIVELLENLNKELINSQLPIYTQKIIKSNLEAISLALDNYKIMGITSVQNAMKSVAGDIYTNKNTLSEFEKHEDISAFKKILTKTNVLAEKLIKADKAITAGGKAIEHTSKAIDLINKLL